MSKQHKIILASKAGPQGGGASMVACQLEKLIRIDESYQVEHWTGENYPLDGRKSINSSLINRFGFRIGRLLSRRVGLPDFLGSPMSGATSGVSGDLYHIHDISSAFSPYTLKMWAKKSPTIWTFHDCSPFTGGCIYPLGCVAYLTRCKACPQLSSGPLCTQYDHTGYMQDYKIHLINNFLSRVICPSHWIALEAKRAGVREDIIHIIPNAVDTNIFNSEQRQNMREQFSISENDILIMLGSVNLTNPYKGSHYALQALVAQKKRVNVLLVGQNANELNLPEGPNYIVRPYTTDRRLLASYYAACDLLLFPSVAENAALMLLESMSCATPAIAFDTGGNSEVIKHLYNGWLAPNRDVESLIAGLSFAISNPVTVARWAERSQETVLSRHTEEIFWEQHKKVYEMSLSKYKHS